jgi:hypothetical protein
LGHSRRIVDDDDESNEALVDHGCDLVASQALHPSQSNQLINLRQEGSTVNTPNHANAPASSEFDETFISKDVQGLDDRVLVDAEFRGEVHDGREAFTGTDLAVGDRSSNLGGDLQMQRSERIT